VIKRIASLLVGLSSISHPLSAQADKAASAKSERWMIYDRVASDGKPLVVVVKAGNASAKALLLNGRATAIICRADLPNVNDQGMPEGTQRLYPLEDNIDKEPALLASGVIRVASVTGQGQRRIFVLHRDPLDLSQILRTIQVRGFSCDASEVNDRSALVRLLTPTPLEFQMNGDREVIANVQKNGDDGHTARKTDFWFYGKKRSLEKLFFDLKSREFTIDHWLNDPTGVVLSRKMPVDFAVFRELTPIIVEAVKRSEVDYDGWETVVVSQPPTKADGRSDY
jgi:hypothetical protein